MYFSHLVEALRQGSAGLQRRYKGHGRKDPVIYGAASLGEAGPSQLSFLAQGYALIAELENSQAAAVLLPDQDDLVALSESHGLAWATFTNPRLAFAESLEILYPRRRTVVQIHPSVVIAERVELAAGVSIGARVCIGEDCRIGTGTILHPGVVIYPDVIVEDYCEVHANAVLHPGSRLGRGCVVHSNAVIGSEGFGFVSTVHGWRKMPQTGRVILEEGVEVGCSSAIDRPAVGETRIGAGTKIDNLVQIGHGVTVGCRCVFASQVGIAGGARLGNGVVLAGQVGVANRAVIGNQAIASAKSGIHGEVPAGEVVSGFPAISNSQWLRCSAVYKKLPEMANVLRKLKQSIKSNAPK